MQQMLIQVEADSCDRKIYNEKTLEYIKTNHGSLPYPFPYGFIVGTSAEDGDCVDCYLITKNKVNSGSIVECDPIGLLEQHEGDEIDHKVLAVLPGEDRHLDPFVIEKIINFIEQIFAEYPDMNVRVGPVHSRESALQYLQESNSK